MVKLVIGDLLDAEEQYIAHQCNCVTPKASGLALYLYNKFPYSNVYLRRGIDNHHDKPGTIQVSGNGEDKRYVINMFSQYYPGGAWDDFKNDTYSLREEYFKKCLNEISQLPNINSVAFPYKIGCGLAGGNWDNYLNMIKDFADKNLQVEVVIYQREGDL